MTGLPEKCMTWDQDTYRELARSRQRAWIVAAASTALALLALLALLVLIPLKEAVPYVVLRDRETGQVEVLRQASASALTTDEALSEFHVVRYVSARESYEPQALQTSYDLVYLSSSPEVFAPYSEVYRRGTAGSLLDRFGRATVVSVSIKSVAFLEPDLAFVRFSATERTGPRQQTSHLAATLRFQYVTASSDLRDRERNPLGFQVTSYRVDQEILNARE